MFKLREEGGACLSVATDDDDAREAHVLVLEGSLGGWLGG